MRSPVVKRQTTPRNGLVVFPALLGPAQLALDGVSGATSEADLEISEPDEQRLLMQALRQVSPRR